LRDVVDHAVQDTFLALWREAGSYRGGGDVAAFIWGIGIRRLIDAIRREKDPSLMPWPAAPQVVISAEDQVLVGIEHGRLGQALADLSPDNRAALLVRVALPDRGPARRLLGRCGIPDYLIDLVAATPALRTSWLLSVAGVLVMVAGEAAAVRYGWIFGYRNPAILVPFLLVAPLLVLAGVAAAFLPAFDPAHRLAVAAPFSGVRLLLARTVSALSAALVPVVAAAFVVPVRQLSGFEGHPHPGSSGRLGGCAAGQPGADRSRRGR
jgi:hypothetical protein